MLNISIAQTLARYGAFPSEKVWYVAAGQFPSTTEPDVFKLTNRIHYRTTKGNMGVKMTYADQIKANPTPNYDWAGSCHKHLPCPYMYVLTCRCHFAFSLC